MSVPLAPPTREAARPPREVQVSRLPVPPQEPKAPAPFWTRLLARPVQFVLDLLVLSGAFAAAYLLRFDLQLPEQHLWRAAFQLVPVVAVQIAALRLAGVYRFIWRYVGLAEVRAFALAALGALIPPLAARLLLPEPLHLARVPLGVIVVDTVLAFGGVLALRVLRRVLYERYEKQLRAANRPVSRRKPVLLVGAGRAGLLAAKEILGRGDLELDPVGFVDDDPKKLGSTIQGLPVLGSTADLPRLVAESRIDHVVITIAQASRDELRRIVKLCERIPVRVRIIPGLFELLDGRVEVSRIRDVDIEDLLGRERVQLDEAQVVPFLQGRTILVTGAGGSIGSELARQVARFEPARLLLVERSEFALFQVDRELRELWPELEIVPLLADIGDGPRMRSILGTHAPQVLLHAAAHKHVPMMESNVAEAIKNNVLATHALGQMAGECGVEVFVLISTDKAVRPTSVMGASKRLAELVVQHLERQYPTRYVAVRFGNVIGSAGSVVPIFREQILRGGPVTVTHRDMRRYFMTIPEASQLVLQAAAMGEGGEIFILDMGEPVRILDLAEDMIALFGLKPYTDVDIVFTGVRPGEKLFEELEFEGERVARTRHPKILVGSIAGYPEEQVEAALAQLADGASREQDAELRACLAELLPESRLQDLSPCR